MRLVKIIYVLLSLSALSQTSWGDGGAKEIAEDINKELRVPYMVSDVRMVTRDKARPDREDVTAFTLRLAAYPDGSEKTAVEIREGRPNYRGSRLILERARSGESSIRFVSKSGRRIRTGSDPENHFQFSLLQVTDFHILERFDLWDYGLGHDCTLIAGSRDARETVYSRREIKTAGMPDGSVVRMGIDYFIGGKPHKSYRAYGFAEVSPGVWRPSTLVMENSEKKTTLSFSGWRAYNEIPESVFR